MNSTSLIDRNDSVVIIPMYNEKENAAKIIDAVIALPRQFDILVIDDNSPDGTANIVKEKQQEYPGRVHLIQREGKLGLGTAYITGFKWSIEQKYDYIFEMDADFSHNPNDLLALYDACAVDGADMSIGSRYITGVNVVNWPMGRVLMSYYASKYVRIVTGMKICDTTAGFVCYTRRVLEALPLDEIRVKGYAFQIDSVVKIVTGGEHRVLGESKMNSVIFGEAVFGVIKLRMSSLFKKFPDYSKK